MGLVALGEQTIPSGIAALLIAMMPVWVAVLGRIFFGERLPGLAVVGHRDRARRRRDPVGPSRWRRRRARPGRARGLSSRRSAWSLGLAVRHAPCAACRSEPLLTTGLQMLAGALVLVVLARVTGELAALRSGRRLDGLPAGVRLPDLVGSLVAFTTYGWLLGWRRPPRIATYAYVNPIVAVVLGAIVLSEPITRGPSSPAP